MGHYHNLWTIFLNLKTILPQTKTIINDYNENIKPFREAKKDFNKVTKLESFNKPKKSPAKVSQTKFISNSKSNIKHNQEMASHVKNLDLHNKFVNKSKSVINTRIDSS